MARWRTGPDGHGMSTSPIAARRAAEAADAALPARESPRRRALIRSVAVAALAMSVAYLAWRGLFTLDASAAWLSVPLYILEIHAAFGLFLFTVSLWDLDVRPAIAPTLVTRHRVAVLIPTYNEGREILLPTVAAALAMRVEHETWVLDDGNRPDVQRMAEELGARYLARRTHEHAKAGNLNHAFGIIDADLVAVLDADHVSHPDFLVRTLGYFDDPRIALVQTPQDFYNRSSFEHQVEDREDGRFHEQVLFYRAIQPGKNRWGAAFWCGTGAIVRTAALRDVGGVATDSITEDIETRSASIGVAGRPSITTRSSRMAWRPPTRTRTRPSDCAGARARCRSCAATTRSPGPACPSVSGWAMRRRCSAGSMRGARSGTCSCPRPFS
jgi:cellulose synthase (UDP-forming)